MARRPIPKSECRLLSRADAKRAEKVDAEESITVAVAARRLGCATSTVRALLDAGELSGHRVGKGAEPRGVRVHADSIRAYKQRRAVRGKPAPTPAQHQRAVLGLPQYDATRRLREMGVILEPESADERHFWAQHGRRHKGARVKR